MTPTSATNLFGSSGAVAKTGLPDVTGKAANTTMAPASSPSVFDFGFQSSNDSGSGSCLGLG